MNAPLIAARGLCKHYGDFALRNVDLTVRPGEIVGFVGQNGAGKTTTIKLLLGLIAPDAGGGTVLGVPVEQMGRRPGVAAKERIGTVFDTLGMPDVDSMLIGSMASVMPYCFADWDREMFARLTAAFGIDLRKSARQLSRGMGMKLSIAIALSHRAKLLILDEATAGLDPMARDDMLDLLRDFVADGERGILMSSHITSDLDKIADRVVCIDQGRIVFDEPKDEITDRKGILRCRERDLERIRAVAQRLGPAESRVLRHEYGVDVAVPDRFAFGDLLGDLPCETMTIDDYLHFMLKGERL